nr:MAG TPA: hypothetical protein [Caudoviricetes sp.]
MVQALNNSIEIKNTTILYHYKILEFSSSPFMVDIT